MIYQPIEIILTRLETGILIGKFEWPEGYQAILGFIWNRPYKIISLAFMFQNINLMYGDPDEDEGC